MFLSVILLAITFTSCNQAEVIKESKQNDSPLLSYKQTRDVDVYIADGSFNQDPLTYDGDISKAVESQICDNVESICFIIVSAGTVVSIGDTVNVKINGNTGYVTREGIVNSWENDNSGNVSDYNVTLF